MATFKVGQRVRIVSSDNRINDHLIGREAVIIRRSRGQHPYGVIFTLDILDCYGLPCLAASNHLTPLTDPGADAFIERIKKLSREPINEVPKVTVEK